MPQPLLPFLPVVEDLYVFCDVLNRLLPCPVTTMMHKLAFERSPEAFHRSIVIVPKAFGTH